MNRIPYDEPEDEDDIDKIGDSQMEALLATLKAGNMPLKITITNEDRRTIVIDLKATTNATNGD